MAATSGGAGRAAPQPGNDRPPAIDVRGLHKSFGQVRAVQGVDLAIASGEIVAMLGGSACGLGGERGCLAGHLRRRRDLAVPDGHGTGLSDVR